MKVQFSDNAFMPGPRAFAAEPSPAVKDFAGALAKASTTKGADPTQVAEKVKKTAETVTKTTGGGDVKQTVTVDKTPADKVADKVAAAPKGERTRDIPGHAYDEIVAGPRNGMMLNDSGNARDGKAFTRVERDGRAFHIYGTGKDRKIFEVAFHDDDSKKASKTTPTTPTARTGATVAKP